jgi:cyclopropane fatty-acyl-phospholipid synthase-like methyltransferase
MQKPFSPSCERNQNVIFDILKCQIRDSDQHLLEIGSGTGQHAAFMAPQLPSIQWHTSDILDNHQGIMSWVKEVNANNVHLPLEYQAGTTDFPKVNCDIIYTANTLHIMSWQNVRVLIRQLGEHLKSNSKVIIYGPFNYNGQFTSSSNADFDVSLRDRNSGSAIRDFEEINKYMQLAQLTLMDDIEMPANNRILIFQKQ